MHSLIKEIVALDANEVNAENILSVLEKTNWEDFKIPALNIHAENDYCRIPLLHDFVSMYLMYWPGGAVSSIHEHKNFQGLIKILEGDLYEKEFNWNESENKLELISEEMYRKGSILKEQNDAIHQVNNAFSSTPVISLHIYFPPTQSLYGSRLFDPERGRFATLSNKAQSFSWKQPQEAFESISHSNFGFSKTIDNSIPVMQS